MGFGIPMEGALNEDPYRLARSDTFAVEISRSAAGL